MKDLIVFIICFMIYSYLGATLEHLSYYFDKLTKPEEYKPKALANPVITGFPLYGMGAYLVLCVSSILKGAHPLIHFLIYGTVLSMLEYMAGVYVGAGTDSYQKNGMVDSWDYSNEKFNIGGKVSLRHFISWGLLGLLVVIVHKPIIKLLKCK